MNSKKFINSDYLKNNPLCGIDTYKDKLNLATGACTRKIKKLVLNGTENWVLYNGNYYSSVTDRYSLQNTPCRCTHTMGGIVIDNGSVRLKVFASRFTAVASNLEEWKTYLQQQYQNGVPVIVWYFLAEPTTETITVPSGLSGTEEGYLIQDGTPTPTNPIYPTVNTVEKWFDSPHYIMGTDTDTITTPAVLYPNDTTAIVGLKGDMSQSGTPTPTSPIQPSECGDKTANLWDKGYVGYNYAKDYKNYNPDNALFLPAGTYTISSDGRIPIIQAFDNGTQYTDITSVITTNDLVVSWNGYAYVPSSSTLRSATITISSDCIITLCLTVQDGTYIMLNTGSTSLPYEPWGIKIPILSNSTTTPVYLGEVQSTRRIKKLVLTGSETWSQAYNGDNRFFYIPTLGRDTTLFSTHFTKQNIASTTTVVGLRLADDALRIRPENVSTMDTSAFKNFLATQYAAGTPVTVWYVLSEPQTAVVNEPIRKIGDYADEVSGITIPTIAGANTLSIGTTVQPSEVTANYHGWHPVTNVHERENGAWD